MQILHMRYVNQSNFCFRIETKRLTGMAKRHIVTQKGILRPIWVTKNLKSQSKPQIAY